MKAPRHRFHSSGDIKQFAKDYKNQMQLQFQNHLQNQMQNQNQIPNHGANYNINYNINQNILQNIIPPNTQMQSGKTSHYSQNLQNQQQKYENYQNNMPVNYNNNNYNNSGNNLPRFQDQIHKTYFSPLQHYMPASASPDDSKNFSFGDDSSCNMPFMSLRPQPKRINSSGNLELQKKSSQNSVGKIKSSLFMMNNDKEEKGDDFNNVQEVLDSITCELWEYTKTQKGSR